MADEQSTSPDFDECLNQLFDELVVKMNQPGNGEAVDRALFGGPETLIKAYRPGETESQE